MQIFLLIILWLLIILISVSILLLLVPIVLNLSYSDFFCIEIQILSFKFKIFSNENKIIVDEFKEEVSLNDKDSFINKFIKKIRLLIKKKGIINFFKYTNKILIEFNNFFRRVFMYINLEKLIIDIGISSEEAANTAVNYSKASAIIYSFFSRIIQIKSPKIYNINVYPDFKRDDNHINFKFYISISGRIIFIVCFMINLILKLIKSSKNYN